LKFGGGKALTKHAPDETTLKCHLTIEETKIAESNRLVICDTPTIPQLENKLEVTPIRTGIKMKSNGLENDMPELRWNKFNRSSSVPSFHERFSKLFVLRSARFGFLNRQKY
jgi:hypothetical protein